MCKRHCLLVLVVALAVVVSACGDDSADSIAEESTSAARPIGTDGTTTVSDEDAADATLDTRPPNPASIAIATDDDHAATGTIGRAGGTLGVTTGDGTEYTLTVPGFALLSPVEIMLIPVDSVSGDVLEGTEDVSAVVLEPSGLVFLTPATLEITSEALTAESVAFSAGSQGDDFHLVPSRPASNTLTTTLTHFSLWGSIGRADIESMLGRYYPSSANRQALQQVALAERASETALEAAERAVQALEVWEVGIQRRASAVLGDDLKLQSLVAEMLTHGMLGTYVVDNIEPSPNRIERIDSSQGAVVTAVIEQMLDTVRRQDRDCSAGDPTVAFPMLRWQMVGLLWQEVAATDPGTRTLDRPEVRPHFDEFLAETQRLVRECFKFEVVFETTAVTDGPSVDIRAWTGSTLDLTTADIILITTRVHLGSFLGPIDPGLQVLPNMFQCQVSGAGRLAMSLEADLNLSTNWDLSTAQISAIYMWVSIRESPTMTCGPQGLQTESDFWQEPFMVTSRAAGRVQSDGTVFYQLPVVAQGPLYARFEATDQGVSNDGAPVEVEVDFKLIHTPGE